MYMMRYDNNLIENYILGNDLGKHKLEELEDNEEFMRQVFIKTKDPKMYQMCSNRLKSNYEFALFSVCFFKENSEAINYIVECYFKTVTDLSERNKLCIGISKIADEINSDKLKKYKEVANQIYNVSMININNKIDGINDEKWKKYFGMGFIIIKERYDSNLMRDFFAEKMIEECFKNNNFEKYLHINYKNPDDVIKSGINTTIINFINLYDCNLSEYLFSHPDLVKKARIIVNNYFKRWNKYTSVLINKLLVKLGILLNEKHIHDKHIIRTVMIYSIHKLDLEEFFINNSNYSITPSCSEKILSNIDENKFSSYEEIIVVEVENLLKKEILGIEDNNSKLIKVNFKKNN